MAETIIKQEEAKQENGILNGVIWKQILIFFWPILLGSLFQQLYNTVDTIVIGKAVGSNALAAVGTTGSIISLLVGFFVGISSGATVVLAQYYGAGNQEGVSKTVHTAIAMSFWAGLLLTVVGIATTRPFLILMKVPDEILDDAALYMKVFYAGIIGNLVYNMGTGILRAVGDSKRPLYVLIVCALLNVVLDLLFVLAFHWAVFGVAFATILSQLVSAVIIVAMLMRSEGSYRLYLRKLSMDLPILKEIVRIGIPSGLESVVYSISNVLIQTFVNTFGTTAIAAWSAIGRIDVMMWMVMQAYGISVTTFVGQNFGARQYDRVKKCARTGLLMTMVSIVAISVIIFTLCPVFLSIFTNDQAVIEQGTRFLRTISPSYFTFVFVQVYSATIRGCGESVQPTILSLVSICGVRILWLFAVLPFHRTVETVVFSYDVSWAIAGVCYIVYYLKGRWLKRCIARQQKQTQTAKA
jgi:putative MATE family efflux protein